MGNEGSRLHRGSSSFRRRNSKSGQNYIAEDEMDRNANQEFTLPKPAKRMDKIRRSLSFRRKKKDKNVSKLASQQPNQSQSSQQPNQPQQSQYMLENQIPSSASYSSGTTDNKSSAISSNFFTGSTQINSTAQPISTYPQPTLASTTNPSETSTSALPTTTTKNSTNNNEPTTRPPLWIEDEKKVRAGNCSFQVKYLGYQEVSDSRGMHICEMAIEKLLSEKEKKKSTKAILYVTGDSLRVVDESNKALIVDQTIEKVSFCAPDRHHENGFAYICRDGTARRWLCHGFMAIKDTLKNAGSAGVGSSGGERLSHAVGCAFSVCLEKKQKRERENVSMEVGPNHSFTRFGSFRQASITERFEDPQMVIPKADPVPIKQVDNPHAIERPKANPDAFNRQNPLRGSGVLPMPFKRNTPGYTSLKPGELPSFQQQKITSGFNQSNGTLTPTQSITKISLLTQNHQQHLSDSNSNTKMATNSYTGINKSDTMNTINTISELPEENLTNTNESTTTLNNINSNNNNNLAYKLNTQLNILTSSSSQNQITKQQQFYQSVFATPQSMPPTPQTTMINNSTNNNSNNIISNVTPPPLPPMPSKYLSTTPMLNQQQYSTSGANGTVMYTPLISSSASSMNSHSANTNLLSSPSSVTALSTSNTNANETFEQKWARIQAAKKTNPFAEDIAKKFEIKL